MRILFEGHHPAHLLFFRHIIPEMLSRGHEIFLAHRDRGPMLGLAQDFFGALDPARFSMRAVSRMPRDNRFPLVEFLRRQWEVFRLIGDFRPDLLVAMFGVYTQSAWLRRVPHVIFTDSEFQRTAHRIAHPFTTMIVTPECYRLDEGRKQRRYPGYHELAYLHPLRFHADSSILEELGLDRTRPLFLIRLSDWNTLHDAGLKGFVAEEKLSLVSRMAQVGQVLISFEGSPPPELQSFAFKAAPARLHHLVAHCDLVVSEGATIASEAACLGVPSVYVNPTYRGYLQEQEERYGLTFNFHQTAPAIVKVDELLGRITADRAGLKSEWDGKRQAMLAEKIDVTTWVADLLGRVGVRV